MRWNYELNRPQLPIQPHANQTEFKTWRISQGLSVAECADRLGITLREARVYSNGTRTITVEIAEKVLPPERWWWKNPELYAESERAIKKQIYLDWLNELKRRAANEAWAAEELSRQLACPDVL